uniref:Uncharacterized protein n=1 Tax=Panagrolaimus superbus TaxID=310955 RepID=A0A914YU06_9BILA
MNDAQMHGNNGGGYVPLGGIMPSYGLAPGPPSQQQQYSQQAQQQQSINEMMFSGMPPPPPQQPQQQQYISASGGAGGGGGGYDRPPPSLAPGAPIGGGPGGIPMGPGGPAGPGGDDGSGGPPGPPIAPQFQCPRRPNIGMEGRSIVLKANHFKVGMPAANIHYYQIEIQPDKCPRKVNR